MTLAQPPEQVFTREQLLVLDLEINTGPSRTLNSHVARLRRKLRDARAGELIHNVRAVGYSLSSLSPTAEPPGGRSAEPFAETEGMRGLGHGEVDYQARAALRSNEVQDVGVPRQKDACRMRFLKGRWPSPAFIIAVVALCVALGGTAFAVSSINGNLLRNRSVAGVKLKKHTITGREVNLKKLGTVPSASNASTLGGIGPTGFVLASKLFSSGVVQLNPGVGNATQSVLINDAPLSVVGVCTVDGTGHADGFVLIATTANNTTWSNGNNGNFTIGPSTPSSMRTIEMVGPAVSQGYVAGKTSGAVAQNGTTLDGIVSAGLFVPAPGGPKECLFHVDAFG